MTVNNPSARSRAQGALVGLAVGDAAGFPSLFHRTTRMGWRRSVLWRFAGELDDQHVLRFPLPFTLGRPDELLISPTDDSEFAAVTAVILLEADGDYSQEALAEITHAEDGVWAAEAMAATIAAAVGGSTLPVAVEAGRRRIPADCWLSRQLTKALHLAEQAASPFGLAAELSDQVANQSYSFGTVAPETLASAYALALAADGDPMTAIPAATTIAKQADSVPALAGAICGALAGVDRLPAAWRTRATTLRGVCVPELRGVSLRDLADKLISANGHEE